jgi:hypothetical protein
MKPSRGIVLFCALVLLAAMWGLAPVVHAGPILDCCDRCRARLFGCRPRCGPIRRLLGRCCRITVAPAVAVEPCPGPPCVPGPIPAAPAPMPLPPEAVPGPVEGAGPLPPVQRQSSCPPPSPSAARQDRDPAEVHPSQSPEPPAQGSAYRPRQPVAPVPARPLTPPLPPPPVRLDRIASGPAGQASRQVQVFQTAERSR